MRISWARGGGGHCGADQRGAHAPPRGDPRQPQRHLLARGLPPPEHLLVAACWAPHDSAWIEQSSSDASLGQLFDLFTSTGSQPTPSVPELRQLAIAQMRSDHQLTRGIYTPKPVPLDLPLTACWGRGDGLCDREAVAQWAQHTTRAFQLQAFSGGHFFVDEAPSAVATMVEARFAGTLLTPGTLE